MYRHAKNFDISIGYQPVGSKDLLGSNWTVELRFLSANPATPNLSDLVNRFKAQFDHRFYQNTGLSEWTSKAGAWALKHHATEMKFQGLSVNDRSLNLTSDWQAEGEISTSQWRWHNLTFEFAASEPPLETKTLLPADYLSLTDDVNTQEWAKVLFFKFRQVLPHLIGMKIDINRQLKIALRA